MAVRDSIFGSKREEEGFRSIEHSWGADYALHPQFPLSALLTPDCKLPEDEWDLFLKTSIDYVLATKEGLPILAIDFDGMGGGFDRDGEYVQVRATQDPNRKRKFDWKLSFAEQNGFPYHIVSSGEFRHLGRGIELTVVDGIIGSVIANKKILESAPSFLEEHANAIEDQPDWYKSEFIQDLLMGLEIECEAEHSKIWRKKCEVMAQIVSITGTMSYPHRYFTFEEPECPSVEWPPWENSEAFQRRVEAFKRVEVWGCTVTISDTPIGEVSATVRVRNVAHALSLVMEIGELMAWSKLRRLLRRGSRSRRI